MNIKEFKAICGSDMANKVLQENRWEEIKNEQKQYGIKYEPNRSLLAQFGLKKPTCPNCGEPLIKEVISHNDYYEKSILLCSCGYKYAEEWRE